MWDGSDETERWNLAVVDTKKSSPMDSISMHRKRVQRTRFLCVETESNGLSFFALKPSPKDSVFKAGNRVQRTRFLCLENETNGLIFYA